MKTRVLMPTFGLCVLAGVLAAVLWLADTMSVAVGRRLTDRFPEAVAAMGRPCPR